MAAPTLVTGSVTTVNSDASTSDTLSAVTLSSSSDRILVIACCSKDSSSTAAAVSSVTFDPLGTPLTIGSGITLQGTAQLEQEGSYSSQLSLYFILEADLPAAGDYDIDVVMTNSCQTNMWVAFEVNGADQAYDAITQGGTTTNLSSGTPDSYSVTTTEADCLVVDIWAVSGTSESAITFTSTETQVTALDGDASGAVVSQADVATASSKSMEQESNTSWSRYCWNVISFAPAAVAAAVAPLRRRRMGY